MVIGFKLDIPKRSMHDAMKKEKMDRIFKNNAALQFLFGCKTSNYDGILKNAQNQLEKFDLRIQDLEGGQESLFSHLIETSLHYLTSSTTSPPIYAGSAFLNCVVISYFKIIYFWLFIKKNNTVS